MPDDIIYTCPECGGAENISGNVCLECMGSGVLPIRGNISTQKAAFLLIYNMQSKLDNIIAEQAAQRIDLTAALTQIWNKVKDL